jgi:hypothetical protein
MHLQTGQLLGIPIVFDTDREDIAIGDKVREGCCIIAYRLALLCPEAALALPCCALKPLWPSPTQRRLERCM